MADTLSRETRVRLFLAFLILVLVVVNSQSLQVSHQSRELLERTFAEGARARAALAAEELGARFGKGGLEDSAPGLSEALEALRERWDFLSACLLDWNGRILAGSGGCTVSAGEELPELDPSRRKILLEEGWTLGPLASRYDPDQAHVVGYWADREGVGGIQRILRVDVPAPELAGANRRFRSALIYQVTAFSLVLITLMSFLNSVLAPHRRLMAEARSVAADVATPGAGDDDSQFVLSTFQGVVARLKEKEQELAALHRREKTRADESEALATDIIRSMTTGLVSLDPSGVMTLVNPAAEKLFRRDAETLVGKSLSEALPGASDLAKLAEDALHRRKSTRRQRVDCRTETGEELHLGASVIPLVTPSGGFRGAICLLADLTEVIQLRERLFLKENLARLGEMVAGIAHEFRNGLATILGNARLLERAASDEEDRQVARALVDETTALSRVVTEFLQFARQESPRLETLDLAHLAREVAGELATRARASGVSVDVRGDSCPIQGDDLLLRKALVNLVLNAIEAAASHGTEGGGVVHVEITSDPDSAILRVSDNGPGVSPDAIPRIFSPFFTTKPEGTGLGLALVQKIAVSHNGEILVGPAPGEGATFTLRLPVRAETAVADPEWV